MDSEELSEEFSDDLRFGVHSDDGEMECDLGFRVNSDGEVECDPVDYVSICQISAYCTCGKKFLKMEPDQRYCSKRCKK